MSGVKFDISMVMEKILRCGSKGSMRENSPSTLDCKNIPVTYPKLGLSQVSVFKLPHLSPRYSHIFRLRTWMLVDGVLDVTYFVHLILF